MDPIKTQMGRKARKLSRELVLLLDKKQQDYGSKNISAFGELGVLIRVNDKVERLKNLLKAANPAEVQNESIEDTWMDIANYAMIATLIRRGQWK
jgi:hypothetical protein